MMIEETVSMSADMKVFVNHIYEYQKGVRRLVLYTFNGRYKDYVLKRLKQANIDYVIRPVGNGCLNLFFGRKECVDACRLMIDRPLYKLNPEEDFILGAMLGYDISVQCERYCQRKGRCESCCEREDCPNPYAID